MPKKRYTEEQIGFALRQAESGTAVEDSRLHNVFDEQDWCRCGQSGVDVGIHAIFPLVEFLT